ncbi:hypothetical protein HJC23_009926 [Cyclotella cryptica]|uniref:Fe2OG dioxygenase domain-containing protein n=1 Tax=Cyclotella cryptica TaxID=29204 RepID=A0ABD3P1B9_9STRA|eukprot:CCRYP_018319-RA/>CCRYP_018319-RA protein AED:0.02 eAED:0.02 QI:343/1/1/1/1/1/2/228/447
MITVIALPLLWICVIAHAQETTCSADDETCSDIGVGASTAKRKIPTGFLNLSPYRADIHYDDGWFGQYVATMETNGETVHLDTFFGDRFFVTRHGVREGLVDPATDEQYFFTVDPSLEQNDGENNGVQFVLPSHAAPSKTKCKDRYPVCAKEAKRGECTANPGWMIVNCCESCELKEGFGHLLDSKVRCTRERLNATIPAWKEGSLDDLFTKWASDNQYVPYHPRVISSPGKILGAEHDGPWIMVFDSFLDDDEINALLKGASFGAGFQRSTDQGSVISGSGEKEKVISTHRTSSNAWCRQECEELEGVKRVSSRIEKFTGIPQNNYESFQILKYQVGEYYKSHHDSSSNKDNSVSGHRILTFFLYLNDVLEGGHTHFTRLDISVKPKKGRALVWPSVLNEDPSTPDLRMYHEARPVTKGIKFAANHWIHQYDSKNENLWGCSGSFA